MPVAQSDDGARISYETSGNGSLPLVLLHGGADRRPTGTTW
jgi:hypothetical protein